MHDIRYIGIVNCRCLVEVDGVQIALASNTLQIPIRDVNSLNAFLENLEDRLSSGDSFAGLCGVLGGTNMLRILEALYREQTISNWISALAQDPLRPGTSIFRVFFGYIHNCTNTPSPFASELYAIAKAHRKAYIDKETMLKKQAQAEAEAKIIDSCRSIDFVNKVSAIERQNRALVAGWCVERRNIISNVVTYNVNHCEIKICLSRRPEFGDACYVASFLSDMQEALEEKDYGLLVTLVKKSGGKAAIEIMGLLFHDLSIQFFIDKVWNRAKSERMSPKLSTILKGVFGGTPISQEPFGAELLDKLESEIPLVEDYLVTSSVQEIYTDKPMWVLFFYKLDRVFSFRVTFPSSQPLRQEIQKYLVHVAEPYIHANKPYAERLTTTAREILQLVESVTNKEIRSIHDLTIWDVRSAITTMILQKQYSVSSVRRILHGTRCFLAYFDPRTAKKVIPSTLIPAQQINPTPPLDPIVFSELKMYKDDLPVYIWLAFRVYEETGGRPTSIVNLTVNDLVCINNRWAVRIYNYKEADRNTLAGVPNTATHWISDDLGNELSKYISDTEELRSQISTPYIFVYKKSNNRSNSNRHPIVLTNATYVFFVRAFCHERQIVNSEGIVQVPTARSIRAEVGRSKFAAGASADAVSRKLGNTSEVAARHYNREYPLDEAMRRRALYAETLDPKLGVDKAPKAENIVHLNTPMYGRCGSAEDCGNRNDCEKCAERMVERKGGR